MEKTQQEMMNFLNHHKNISQPKVMISNYDFPAEVEDIYKGPVIVKGLSPDKTTGKLERDPKKATQERFAKMQSTYLSLKLILPIGTELSDGTSIINGYQTPYGKAVYKEMMKDLYDELLDFAEDEASYNVDKNHFIGEAAGYAINNVHIAKIRTVVPYFVMELDENGKLTKTTNRFNKPATSNHFTVVAFDREDVQSLARKQLGILYNQSQFVSEPPSGEVLPPKTIPESDKTEPLNNTGTE